MIVNNYFASAFSSAKAEGYPAPYGSSWEEWGDWYNNDTTYGLWRFEDGIAVEFIGMDGGEPEDASLSRDYAWIKKALVNAYLLGIKHGNEDGQFLRA